MSRNPVLKKEDIVVVAFDIVKENGLECVTVREIAKKLNTSTAPIYTQYKNVECLNNDLVLYVKSGIIKSCEKRRTKDPFLNIGVGILAYTLKYKKVISSFFLGKNKPLISFEDIKDLFFEMMNRNKFLRLMEEDILKDILSNMWVFTFGIATLICTGHEKNENLEYYKKKLEDVGHKIIFYHFYSSGKIEYLVKEILKNEDLCNGNE
jgi:AcrR family transcriptional regulator